MEFCKARISIIKQRTFVSVASQMELSLCGARLDSIVARISDEEMKMAKMRN
jgi:hypothetical protein